MMNTATKLAIYSSLLATTMQLSAATLAEQAPYIPLEEAKVQLALAKRYVEKTPQSSFEFKNGVKSDAYALKLIADLELAIVQLNSGKNPTWFSWGTEIDICVAANTTLLTQDCRLSQFLIQRADDAVGFYRELNFPDFDGWADSTAKTDVKETAP